MNQEKQDPEIETLRILIEDLSEHPEAKSANLDFHYRLLGEKQKIESEHHKKLEGFLDEERALDHSTAVDEERFLVMQRIRQLLGWELADG